MGRSTRIELATTGTTNLCSTNWATTDMPTIAFYSLHWRGSNLRQSLLILSYLYGSEYCILILFNYSTKSNNLFLFSLILYVLVISYALAAFNWQYNISNFNNRLHSYIQCWVLKYSRWICSICWLCQYVLILNNYLIILYFWLYIICKCYPSFGLYLLFLFIV